MSDKPHQFVVVKPREVPAQEPLEEAPPKARRLAAAHFAQETSAHLRSCPT
jgi:hypothetical protein